MQIPMNNQEKFPLKFSLQVVAIIWKLFFSWTRQFEEMKHIVTSHRVVIFEYDRANYIHIFHNINSDRSMNLAGWNIAMCWRYSYCVIKK